MNTYADFDLKITRNVPTSTVFVPNGTYTETIRVDNLGPDPVIMVPNSPATIHIELLPMLFISFTPLHGNVFAQSIYGASYAYIDLNFSDIPANDYVEVELKYTALSPCVNAIHLMQNYQANLSFPAILPGGWNELNPNNNTTIGTWGISNYNGMPINFFPNTTYSSQLGFNNLAPGQIVAFQGTFYIDSYFSISGCEMWGGSTSNPLKIVIMPGGELHLDNSNFYACVTCNIWQGIEVMPNGKLFAYNNSFRHAEYSMIEIHENAEVEIVKNTFGENPIAIHFNPSSGNIIGTAGPTQIYGNAFTCDNVIFGYGAGCLGTATITKPWAIYGILVENIKNVTIGKLGAGNENSFTHLNNGISIHHADTKILNNKFEDIRNFYYTPIYCPPQSLNGSGILVYNYGQNYLVKIKGLGIANNNVNTFNKCKFGVNARATNIAVGDCKMSGVNTGISVLGNGMTANYIDIYNNRINSKENGITLKYNGNVPIYNVSNNILSVNQVPTANTLYANGIDVTEQTTSPINIGNNAITITKGHTGIKLNGIKKAHVQGNTINITSVNAIYGIGQYGTDHSELACNAVSGWYYNWKNYYTSYYNALTTNTSMICNSSSATKRGIQFSGDCNNSTIEGNEMYNHYIGLQYGSTAITGQQSHNGNKWIGTFLANSALHQGIQFWVNQSQYYVTNIVPYNPPGNIFPANGWFYPTPGTQNLEYSCSANPNCGDPNKTSELFSTDISIANGTLEPSEYIDETKWQLERGLYEKLKDSLELIGGDSTLLAFYNSRHESNFEDFSELYHIIDANDSRSNWKIQLNNNYIEIEWLTLALQEKDSLLQINENDSLLLAERAALSELIGDLSTHNRLLSDSLHNYADSLATEVADQNANISTQENYEAYERIVNDIYWKTVARGIYEFTNSQTAQLESIISLCPYHGGKAVFYARGLYSLVNDSLTFDDSLLCVQQNVENWRQGNPHTSLENGEMNAVLYPNPASETVTINLSQKPTEATTLYLYDVLGRLVYQHVLGESEKEISISVANMSSGVYYYSFSQAGKTLLRDKFIIEH